MLFRKIALAAAVIASVVAPASADVRFRAISPGLLTFRPNLGPPGTPGTAAEVAAGQADFIAGRTSNAPLKIAAANRTPTVAFANGDKPTIDNSIYGFSTTLQNACRSCTFGPITVSDAYRDAEGRPGSFDAGDVIKIRSAADATQQVTGTVAGSPSPIYTTGSRQLYITSGSASTANASAVYVSDWVLDTHLPPNFTLGNLYLSSNNVTPGTRVADWDFRPILNMAPDFSPDFPSSSWSNPLVFDNCLFDASESWDAYNSSTIGYTKGTQPVSLTNDTFTWSYGRFAVRAHVQGKPALGTLSFNVDAVPPTVVTNMARAPKVANGYPNIRVIDETCPSCMQGTWAADIQGNTITLKDTNTVLGTGNADGPTNLDLVQDGDTIAFFKQPSWGVFAPGTFSTIANSRIQIPNDFIQDDYSPTPPYASNTGARQEVSNNRLEFLGVQPFTHGDLDQIGWLDLIASLRIHNNVIDMTKTPGVNSGGNPRQTFQANVGRSWSATYELDHNITKNAKSNMYRAFGQSTFGYVSAVTAGANGAAHVVVVATGALLAVMPGTTTPPPGNGVLAFSGLTNVPGVTGAPSLTNMSNVTAAGAEFDVIGSTFPGSYALPGAVATSGSTSTASTTLNVADTSQLAVGMIAPTFGSYSSQGTYFATGTFVQALTPTSITLSAPPKTTIPASTSVQFAAQVSPAMNASVSIHDNYLQILPGSDLAGAPGTMFTTETPTRKAISVYNMFDATLLPLTMRLVSTDPFAPAYQHVSVIGGLLIAAPVANSADVQLIFAGDGTPIGWQYTLDGTTWNALPSNLRFTAPARGTTFNVQVRSTNALGNDGLPHHFGPPSYPAVFTTN